MPLSTVSMVTSVCTRESLELSVGMMLMYVCKHAQYVPTRIIFNGYNMFYHTSSLFKRPEFTIYI